MRQTLEFTRRTQRVVVEVSNASAKFETELKQHGFGQDLVKYPADVGRIVVNLVEKWNDAVSTANNGTINLTRSFYLILSYSHKTKSRPLRYYQLHQFAPKLPDPTKLRWSWPVTKKGQKRLIGLNRQGNQIIEWYNSSGGQLKYYPSESEAFWKSSEFNLEPLPAGTYGIVRKAAAYFPQKWQQCNSTIVKPNQE